MSERPARLPGVGEKFIAGDPLRAVCAIMVVTFHVALLVSGYARQRGEGADFEAHFGEVPGATLSAFFLCVYVFLALSGYLVGRPFLRAYVLGRRQPQIRPYARNRIVRIIPLFWFTWTITLLVHLEDINGWRDVVEPYLFAQIYRPTVASNHMVQAWTVDVEFVFYVLLPVVTLALTWMGSRMRLSEWGRAWLFLLPLLVFSVISLILRVGTPGEDAFFQPHTLVFAFAPGLALAALEPLVAPKLRARGEAKLIQRMLLVALIGGSVMSAVLDVPHPWRQTAGGIAAAAFIGLPLVRQWATGTASKLLDNKPLHWFGERSYSVYMLHVLVRERLAPIAENMSTWPALIVAEVVMFAAMVPIAALSFRFIETPFLKMKEFRGGFAPRDAPTDAIPEAGSAKAARQAGSIAP